MKNLCKKTFQFDVKRRILWRISILRRRLRYVWKQFYACWANHRPSPSSPDKKYRQLTGPIESTTTASSLAACALPSLEMPADHCAGGDHQLRSTVRMIRVDSSSDLVSLKIGIFGDPQTGKSSFLAKYAGVEKEFNDRRINHVDKTLCVEGARISYSIWEVGGDEFSSLDHIPSACQDSVAMLFMFDLTSRMTLNSVIKWYQETRKWNQAAIPVLVGTKFDEFVQLPIDLQWTIASQARTYAKALNATLFFSSATYNINVNKIFKFVTAKLFDLQWNVERNLNVGEPIIDY